MRIKKPNPIAKILPKFGKRVVPDKKKSNAEKALDKEIKEELKETKLFEFPFWG